MQAFETFREDLAARGHGQSSLEHGQQDESEAKDGVAKEAEAQRGADPHAAFAKGKPLGVFINEKAPKGTTPRPR